MTTLAAQISTTFTAITAGFYTTKIISITNDKSRIKGKIKELETEYSIVEANQKSVQKQIYSIDKKDAWEGINRFIDHLLSHPMLPHFTIKTVDDLIEIYEKLYTQNPSEQEKKSIKERSQEIIIKVSEEQNKRNSRNTELVSNYPSGEQQIVRAIRNQNEQERYDSLTEKINSASSRLSVLKELLKVSKEELNSAIYPTHIRFGFISFIMFAVLGVFAPLIYNTWSKIISKVFPIPIDTNAFVLILFTVGLALNFIYIGLELRAAISH